MVLIVEEFPATKPGLLWRVEYDDRLTPTRRTLLWSATGEILDDVWLDETGRVCSWSKSLGAIRSGSPRAYAAS
jgi:hypothetical protein